MPDTASPSKTERRNKLLVQTIIKATHHGRLISVVVMTLNGYFFVLQSGDMHRHFINDQCWELTGMRQRTSLLNQNIICGSICIGTMNIIPIHTYLHSIASGFITITNNYSIDRGLNKQLPLGLLMLISFDYTTLNALMAQSLYLHSHHCPRPLVTQRNMTVTLEE